MKFRKTTSHWLITLFCSFALSAAYAQETPPDDYPNDPPIDSSEPTPEPAPAPNKDKVEKKLRADFFLDFDWGEEIINLTPHPRNSEFFESATDTLVMGDYSKGFRVVKYSDIGAGLGAKMTWNWPNRTGLAGKYWLYVGLVPMAGRMVVSNQFQPTMEKALNAKSRKIPMEAKDINLWSENDSVNYSTTGGLIFSTGVGVPGVNLGTDFIVQGTFSTYVEKLNQDEVYVMISNTEAKSLVMQTDATVVQVGVTKYKEIEQGISYLIKYKDPLGEKAYHDLIRGNVAAIQQLLDDPQQTAIQKWENLNRLQLRKMAHFNFGVPFIINWGWTAGNIYEFTDTRAYYDNTRVEADYGIYLKEKRRQIINSKAVQTESFYGTVTRLYNYDNDLILKYIFGQYVFNADDNKTKTKDMNKSEKVLIEKTGLKELLDVNIPNHSKLRFSRINLEVNFDEDQTLRFMDIVNSVTAELIARNANQIANNYILNESTSLSLCTPQETEIPMATTACLEKYVTENFEASSSLQKAAQRMKKHFDSGNDKQFALAYAAFGRAMLTNATMFQAILAMGGAGTEIVYNIQNTFFQNYRVIYTTTDQPGVYIRKEKGQQDLVVFTNKNLNNAVNIASGF